MKNVKIKDYVHGNGDVTVRFDPDEVALLSSSCKLDPSLTIDGKNHVYLLKKMEVEENSKWMPYPSAAWISNGDSFYTVAFVKISGENEITVMSSRNGVQDAELLIEAEKAGIFTAMID